MDKYSIDFTNLDKQINKPKVYKLADVKHKIKKIAFDVVRFTSGEDTAQLWKIEESADGPVIVAMYDAVPSDNKISEASVKEWSAMADNSLNINIFYKGEAIKKIAASDMGFTNDDVPLMCRWLPNRLASNSELRSALLKGVPEESRNFLFSKYPELRG
jgi:hypothetical protein